MENEKQDNTILIALVEIKVKLERVISDVADINNNLAKKVDKLDCDKFDKSEALERLKTLDDKAEALENWRNYIAGGLAITAAVVGYLVQKYL